MSITKNLKNCSIKLLYFRLQRSSSIFVAVGYISISPFYQPVKIEMMMSFRHGTENLLKTAKPCEGLLT